MRKIKVGLEIVKPDLQLTWVLAYGRLRSPTLAYAQFAPNEIGNSAESPPLLLT
jgi:hypothetical protein